MLFRIHGYNGGILNLKLVRLSFPSQPENVEIFVEQNRCKYVLFLANLILEKVS